LVSSKAWHHGRFDGVLGELCVLSVSAVRGWDVLSLEASLRGWSNCAREELCVSGIKCMSIACSTTSKHGSYLLYLRRRSIVSSSDVVGVGVVRCGDRLPLRHHL
jgi:hypothetical protein